VLAAEDRWLIAIDIDGTLVHDDGYLSQAVVKEVQRVRELGHHIVVATGRSAANAIPVIQQLGFEHGPAVASNGAVRMRVDPSHQRGYLQEEVITFDPTEVLGKLIEALPDAHFAVEDADGSYRFHKHFPRYALGDENIETPLENLMGSPVSRVVVLSPGHDVADFLDKVESIGLQSVSYAIGYTAWLDIAPKGITKASALEKIRADLGVKQSNLIAIGDGRNDINMLQWAQAEGGFGFAMGQGPDEVKAAATAVTSSVDDDGVARVLSGFEGILFTELLG
jgi:Cof subfamily protein (haloacid dehalogenase superfamily)